MKLFLSLSLLLFSVSIFAQQASGPEGFVFVPGGDLEVKSRTVKIKSFFMMAQEVTNEEWSKFVNWTEKNKSKTEAEQLKPAVSKKELKLLPKSYFKSSKYAQYPVVGITRDMAELYCQYLIQIHPEPKGLYRLPFEREWIYAAKGGHGTNTFSIGNAITGVNNEKLGNYNLPGTNPAPMPAKSFQPNAYGLYNMSGNVAEWVREEGKAKGGSWIDKPEELLIDAKDPRFGHPEASAFTGFRVVWMP